MKMKNHFKKNIYITEICVQCILDLRVKFLNQIN